ncbi:MAG TPA: hypothetical protein VL326_03400 [Kofleriaceae bacterium]|jgi:hypothetical protein|nr:hypothetical protein [Kofleriaceae bacterium]
MKYFASILFVAACGSKSPAPTTPAPETTATTETTPAEKGPPPPLPDKPFDDLDQDQRAQFMKEKVVPAMEPIFKNHDAKKFAEFGCTTCHGEQAKQGHFDMPNPDLPKLLFKDKAAMAKFKKEDLEWMSKEVKPTMAKLLSMPELTPDNPKGFGCQSCHTTE